MAIQNSSILAWEILWTEEPSGRPRFSPWVGKIPWRRLLTPEFLGFLGGSDGKESAHKAGDLGLIPGLERSSGEGKGYPLQYSGLENSMGCIVHGVPKSWTELCDFHFHTLDTVYKIDN